MKDIRAEHIILKLPNILAEIEKREIDYKAMVPLSFIKETTGEPVKLKKNNNAESFVRKFFEKFNKEYETIIKSSKETYCGINTRRSIEDVFRLAYSYLGEKITLKDIIIATYNKILAGELTANNCYQINKRVYKDRPQQNGNFYNSGNTDELGFTRDHYTLLTK